MVRTSEVEAPEHDTFRRLVEATPAPMYVTRDGVVLFVNAAAVRLFGATSADDLLGTRILDRVHPSAHALATERRDRLLGGADSVPRFELQFIRLDGTEIDVEIDGTTVLYEGAPAICAVVRDISEHRQAEAARRDSEETLRSIFATMSEGVALNEVVYDANGEMVDYRILLVNEAFYSLADYGDQPVIGNVATRLYGMSPESITAFWRSHRDRSDVQHAEFQAPRNGRWYFVSTSPIVANRFVTSFVDITERREAEERRAQSHALLSNLARLVPSAIYQYRLYPDGSSAFPYANHGINDIYEVTPEEVQFDATPVFGRLHPDDAERVGQLIMESARTLEEFYCEFRVVLPRQGLRWRWSQAHPERMDDGGTLWHGIISDITERKIAEQEKARLEAQLTQAQKMESVGLLAGGVAHDFNNMLGVILGYADLAMAQEHASPSLSEALVEIRKAATRSAALTRQLLAFARQQTIAPTVLDLNETVPGMLAMLQRLIGEDVALTWQPGAALWPVLMDASQMDQILTNLCVNARHAIADVGSITIATANAPVDAAFCAAHAQADPGDYVRLTVRDTGCGMDAATQARIFEPFFSTKGVGKGTGLGLATVYGAVVQNRGFVTVASAPGEGTTFEIFLPRHGGAAASINHEIRAESERRGGETILMVEDEPALLRLVKRALEDEGYAVLAANGAADARRLAAAYAGEIHLLLSDVVMPEMNGRDLATELQRLRPTLKLLFMSGHTAGIIASRGLLAPGLTLIEKPFTPLSLAAKVREVLDAK